MSEVPAAPRRVIPPPVVTSRGDEALAPEGVVRDVGVVIVAGGSGSRTGSAELKQFRCLNRNTLGKVFCCVKLLPVTVSYKLAQYQNQLFVHHGYRLHNQNL